MSKMTSNWTEEISTRSFIKQMGLIIFSPPYIDNKSALYNKQHAVSGLFGSERLYICNAFFLEL